jgi:hypothetical protein
VKSLPCRRKRIALAEKVQGVLPDATLPPQPRRLRTLGSARQTTRVTIDVNVGSEPISGQVDLCGKRTEAFVGWSTLAELLEEARMAVPCTGAKTVAPNMQLEGE